MKQDEIDKMFDRMEVRLARIDIHLNTLIVRIIAQQEEIKRLRKERYEATRNVASGT